MDLHRKPSIGFLYIVLTIPFGDAEDVVIIAFSHDVLVRKSLIEPRAVARRWRHVG
jgi:hypothetical protein